MFCWSVEDYSLTKDADYKNVTLIPKCLSKQPVACRSHICGFRYKKRNTLRVVHAASLEQLILSMVKLYQNRKELTS